MASPSCAETVAAEDAYPDFDVPSKPDAEVCSEQKEFSFVERPSHDFFCPVSLDLLLEPHLTSCCGHHLSQEAATRLHREGKPCPMCNTEQWGAVLDKYHRRKAHEVRVRCWHSESGCGWVGEVNELERHADSCKKRPWQCEHCGLRCTHAEGEGKHWWICPEFPEPCPNRCEVGTVDRCNMRHHRNVCSMEPVACEMKEFGCSVVVPRKELATHMRESELHHLTNMTMLNLSLSKQLQQEAKERDKQVTQLQLDVTRMQTEMKDDAKTMMQKTTKEQKQMQFEQNKRLNKIQERISDDQKQVQSDIQTDMKLKFDEQKASFHRLEQVLASDRRISQLQTELSVKIAQLERETAAKLELQRKMIEAVRLSVSGMDSSVNAQIGELKRLVSAPVPQASQSWEPTASRFKVEDSISCSGTELFTFDNYSQDKGTGVCRSSDPFYTHFKGYKLKLHITFYSSPNNDIGAELYLMKGEYDRQLDWPVEIRVRLEVVNQAGSHRNVVKATTCNWDKTEKEQARTIHSCLMKYATLERDGGSVQYMMNDCLKFKIYVTVQ